MNLSPYTTEIVGSLSLPAGAFLVNVTAVPYAWDLTDPDSVVCYLWDGIYVGVVSMTATPVSTLQASG